MQGSDANCVALVRTHTCFNNFNTDAHLVLHECVKCMRMDAIAQPHLTV
uniref:Uncharacterized protein n=1 Tax=Anguilla anguilla TaxID=7936 RepID=A0A0E9RC67_ANGAN